MDASHSPLVLTRGNSSAPPGAGGKYCGFVNHVTGSDPFGSWSHASMQSTRVGRTSVSVSLEYHPPHSQESGFVGCGRVVNAATVRFVSTGNTNIAMSTA